MPVYILAFSGVPSKSNTARETLWSKEIISGVKTAAARFPLQLDLAGGGGRRRCDTSLHEPNP